MICLQFSHLNWIDQMWWINGDLMIFVLWWADLSKWYWRLSKKKRHVSLTWALSFVKQVWRINGKKPNYLDCLNKEKEKKKSNDSCFLDILAAALLRRKCKSIW